MLPNGQARDRSLSFSASSCFVFLPIADSHPGAAPVMPIHSNEASGFKAFQAGIGGLASYTKPTQCFICQNGPGLLGQTGFVPDCHCYMQRPTG